MKRTIVLLGLSSLTFVAGCSSLPLPELPSISMPWSSTAKPDPNADAVFNRGMALFNNKKYAAAADQFTRIKQEFPFAPQAIDAELKLAESYYLNQQYPEAITAFQEFQSLHPSNENIPLVIYRLGLAHFDQFTSTDRDQKNTEIARGHFETVINNHPKSPYAAEAKQKLAKCIEYLAEHDFNVAAFYFQQEKYAAARDRFEEIVRRYRGTPTAVKSLFYLGESYRKEKNGVKAALAYEAIIQHYPQSKFVNDAKTQLAELEKEKDESPGVLASLWPFGGKNDEDKQKLEKSKNTQLVDQIDDSLMGKGIDSKRQTAALKPPAASLPKVEETASLQPTDAGELLGKIDISLKKDGKDLGELPPTPEAAEVFKDPAAAQAIAAKTTGTKVEPPPESIANSGLLGSIDDKLKSKGIEPSKFELPAPPESANGTAPRKDPVKKVELEPKVSVEKGPLFLGPSELEVQDNATSDQDSSKEDKKRENSDKPQEPAVREIPRALVRGPVQPQPVTPAPKGPEQKKSTTAGEDEEKGVLDQLKEDADTIGRILNPFRW